MVLLMLLAGSTLAEDQMVRPVDSSAAMGRASFQADYDRVWSLLTRILSDYRFEFSINDKTLGKLETSYVTFSRHPQFSRLSGGVRSYAAPPRLLFRRWLDARMRLRAQVTRLSSNSTQVFLQPEIQGFASTFFDDSTVTGEWRDCRSNGKFEFELFNEMATQLKKGEPVIEVADPKRSAPPTVEAPASVSAGEGESLSNLLVQSIPEGAEIFLNNKLVGMTPSRLSIPPGQYVVMLRKAGYKDYFKSIEILRKSDLTISTELERK